MDELMVIRAIYGAAKLSNAAFDEAIESITDETDPKIDVLCRLANECEGAYGLALSHLIEGNSVECREMLEQIVVSESNASGLLGRVPYAVPSLVSYARPILGMFP